MKEIDGVLIDGIVQPAADWLARWLSCFAVVRLFTYSQLGIIVIQYFPDGARFPVDRGGFPGFFMILLGIPVLSAFAVILLSKKVERRLGHGQANPMRMALRVARPANLILMSYVGGKDAMDGFIAHDVWGGLLNLAYSMAWVGIVYFGSCQLRPPKPRRRTAPAGLQPSPA